MRTEKLYTATKQMLSESVKVFSTHPVQFGSFSSNKSSYNLNFQKQGALLKKLIIRATHGTANAVNVIMHVF